MVAENDWRRLCEQAAREQDPKRLLQLTEQINRILAQKDDQKRGAEPTVPRRKTNRTELIRKK
jgi:hypothetical protein